MTHGPRTSGTPAFCVHSVLDVFVNVIFVQIMAISCTLMLVFFVFLIVNFVEIDYRDVICENILCRIFDYIVQI